MRETTIARNYAETLLALAGKGNDLRGWGTMITDIAAAMNANPKLRLFLESPRVGTAEKNAVLTAAFTDKVPRNFGFACIAAAMSVIIAPQPRRSLPLPARARSVSA